MRLHHGFPVPMICWNHLDRRMPAADDHHQSLTPDLREEGLLLGRSGQAEHTGQGTGRGETARQHPRFGNDIDIQRRGGGWRRDVTGDIRR